MEKVLFIISLKYPIINAINLCLKYRMKADIILIDHGNDLSHLAPKLQKTNLFKKVFLINGEKQNKLKSFLKGEGCLNDVFEWGISSFQKLFIRNDEEYRINCNVENNKNINISEYNKVYVKALEPFSEICLDYLTKKENIKEINIIEEGINSYCNSKQALCFCERYKNVKILLWVYDPALLMFQDSRIELRQLPLLSSQNKELKAIVNSVFSYTDNISENFNNTIIYFEQVAEPMPKYLRNAGIIKRILFFNPLKKHAKEEHLYQEKCKVMRFIESEVLKKYKNMKLLIKLHPRTREGFPPDLRKYIWENSSNGSIPWEVYILNNKFKNSFWITTASGAVTNVLYCFEDDCELKIGLTYKLDKEYKKYLNENLDKFYKKLKDKYGKISIYNDYYDMLN